MVLKDRITLNELVEKYNHWYPDRVKFCIDRKRKIIAIDREMHIEMEHELYDDGSEYTDIFGGDILTEENGLKILWEAHPNIERNRELQIGAGRPLVDEGIITELTEIIQQWIQEG